MAFQSLGVNVKQYCPLLVVTFPFLLKNFFFEIPLDLIPALDSRIPEMITKI